MNLFRKLFFFLVFLVLTPTISKPQQNADIEALKKTALSHMQAGRYGEAIDQLNKYVAANPQQSDAYNLRAICFEKRQQYENGRLDYRRAISLESRDANKRAEYERNLQRLIDIWYPILNKKIEGHQREIAIDPNPPFNYLEIGKSYKLLEIWDKAELWYDEYLKRDDNASPDEIIRYTEILAKTGSIVKGEKILKKFTDRYPQDWRLWERYGWFTYWNGKYQLAKKAFETALGFKPYFKGAQDGLDLVNRHAYLTQEDPRDYAKEYPIDRYYRILKKSKNDIETRFKLVDELISAGRLEEAYQQLQIIGVTKSDDTRYQEKWKYITDFRQKTYHDQLELAKAKLAIDPLDKDALKSVAQLYENLQNYDSAAVMLNRFFEQYPDEKDTTLRYRFTRITAWNREFDKAITIIDNLLKDYPNNLDYQLFRAQVSVWISRDLDLAKQYLDNVLAARPNNIDALISMGSLVLIQQDFEKAQDYANKAKEIDPTNEDLIKLQSNIDWQKMRAEEEKVLMILEEGRKRVVANDCPGAIPFYEDYLSKAEPNVLIQKEYGDILFCAKDYKRALDAYNQVLSQGPNFEAQMQRAKLFYTMGDSLSALKEFKDLVKQDSTNFDANLYLADSYVKIAEHDSARAIYNMLLEHNTDSTQVRMINQRKGWLPVTGLAAIFETFPNYVGLAPTGSYYADNIGFRITQFGARLELGLTSFFSFGATFARSWIKANPDGLDQDFLGTLPTFTGDIKFTTFKGHVFVKLSKNLNMGVGLGQSSSQGLFRRDEQDAFFRFEKKDTISVTLLYQSSDASLILFSPYLIDTRYYARLYKIDGYFHHKEGLIISGNFQYIAVTDANEGNDFLLRMGRYFYKNLALGYEYAYDNYKVKTKYYYSPRNFESHSLWLDQEIEQKEQLRVKIGGKLGYIPKNSLIALEAHAEVSYQATKSFSINGKISTGSTSRDDSSYRFFSAQFSAYWNLF